MEKRGASTVVATIILVLILMTVVSLIVLFSSNFLAGLKKDSSTLAPIYQKLKMSIDSVTINSSVSPEIMTISLTRIDNEDIPLKGVRFKFLDINGNSYTYDMNMLPEAGFSKQYQIKNTDINMGTFSSINKVSVSAITPENKQTNDLDEKEI